MLLILVLMLFSSTRSFEVQIDRNENMSLFVPTHEWRIVPPGEVIPPGLHVRQNIQTGVVEAKLMDNTSTNDKLTTGLLPLDRKGLEHPISNNTNQRTKRKFRSYEELRSDFKKFNVDIKKDYEIIMDLVPKLRAENVTVGDLLLHLEDLSYLLQQIDNARDFAKHFGFSLIVNFLHHTDITVQKAAFSVLSAALQGDVIVKRKAMHDGVLDHIHHALKSTLTMEFNDRILDLVSAGLLALGNFLRHFPEAQRHFFSPLMGLAPPGFELLSGLANLKDSYKMYGRNLRMMILTLLSNLYDERNVAKFNAQSNPTENEINVWDLYSSIPFEESFLQSNWCDTIFYSFIHEVHFGVSTNILQTDVNHDRREKILNAFASFVDLCNFWKVADGVKNHKLLAKLRSLETEYAVRSQEEIESGDESDAYFTQLLKQIKDLIVLLSDTSVVLPKEEL